MMINCTEIAGKVRLQYAYTAMIGAAQYCKLCEGCVDYVAVGGTVALSSSIVLQL